MHNSYKRRPDGKYSINGRVFERLVGSRAQVWHETAYKTSGGLTRMDLVMNKNGRIVSEKKHKSAKRIADCVIGAAAANEPMRGKGRECTTARYVAVNNATMAAWPPARAYFTAVRPLCNNVQFVCGWGKYKR